MNTRFALVAGILVLGIIVTAQLVRPPQPSAFPQVGKDLELQTNPAPAFPASAVAANQPGTQIADSGVRGNLFARPIPETQAPPVEPEPPAQPHGPLSDPAPVVDSLAGYVCTGTVTSNGQTIALLENPRTHTGGYYQQGDQIESAKVAQIDADGVTLEVRGAKRRIPKSNAYNLVPLNAAAPEPPKTATAMNSQAVALTAAFDNATALRMLSTSGAMLDNKLVEGTNEALPAMVNSFDTVESFSTVNP